MTARKKIRKNLLFVNGIGKHKMLSWIYQPYAGYRSRHVSSALARFPAPDMAKKVFPEAAVRYPKAADEGDFFCAFLLFGIYKCEFLVYYYCVWRVQHAEERKIGK